MITLCIHFDVLLKELRMRSAQNVMVNLRSFCYLYLLRGFECGGWKWMMNWEWHERKQQWPNLGYHPNVSLEQGSTTGSCGTPEMWRMSHRWTTSESELIKQEFKGKKNVTGSNKTILMSLLSLFFVFVIVVVGGGDGDDEKRKPEKIYIDRNESIKRHLPTLWYSERAILQTKSLWQSAILHDTSPQLYNWRKMFTIKWNTKSGR